MSWKLPKNLLGTLLQLSLPLLRQLLKCFAKTLKSRSMSRLVQKWRCSDGVLTVEFPEMNACISVSHDRLLVAHRGMLSLPQWLSAIFRFLSVYKKMLSV